MDYKSIQILFNYSKHKIKVSMQQFLYINIIFNISKICIQITSTVFFFAAIKLCENICKYFKFVLKNYQNIN